MNVETIARIKTPKRVVKVVKFADILGRDAYRVEDGQRRRDWRTYDNPDEAVKFILQRAASDYLMMNMFNQA